MPEVCLIKRETREPMPPKRYQEVEVLESGWIKCINGDRYQVHYYPSDRVQRVTRPTNDEEEEEL